MSALSGEIKTNHVAVPAHNISISTITQKSEALFDETSMRFIKIAISLSQEKDLKKLMNLITNEAMQLTSSARGTLYLVDRERQKLIFYVTNQLSFNEITIPLTPESIAGYVGVTGETLMLDDVYELSNELPYKFNKSFDQRTGFRTKSMLVVPLSSHKNEIIGILQLINKESETDIIGYNRTDLELINAVGSLAAVSIENALLYKEIENLFEAFVRYSATAIDERDPCTGGHSRRVVLYSVGLAAALGTFSQAQIKEIKYAAWLHDIGKIGVREAVLSKENKLTNTEIDVVRCRLNMICEMMQKDAYEQALQLMASKSDACEGLVIQSLKENVSRFKDEVTNDFNYIAQINVPGFMTDEKIRRLEAIRNKKYINSQGQAFEFLSQFEYENLMVIRGNLTNYERMEIESHVTKTYEILKHIPFTRELKNVPEFASKHHEKLDGTGYPNRILAANIPVQVRIISIADIYDALTAQDRPYKKAMPAEVALKILKEEAAAGKLDKELLDLFIAEEVYKLSDDPSTLAE
ncbi:MAG TPA: HD domain-containing phosphohydrolase [Candidatus Wallbacteria bacterium]|nr:HD domain-containing phosphohydrolase [Candidatus Wallbacteria bacterium]